MATSSTKRATQTITIKSRKRKTGGNSGYQTCDKCHGTGRVRK